MLYRSNILALVGGGRNPRFQPHKVVLWDDRQPRPIAELSFRTSVKAVKMQREFVAVAIETKVYLYRFHDLQLIDHMETAPNARGILGLVPLASGGVLLVAPSPIAGKLLLLTYGPGTSEGGVSQKTRTLVVSAHEGSLAAVGISSDGGLVATASEKGTLVRVFETSGGQLVHELRRGVDRAEIYCLQFNLTSEYLAVTSDKGTVHLFSVKNSANSKSNLSFLGGYFQSQWSFAQLRIPDYRAIVAFGQDPNTLVVLCADGSYVKAKWDPLLGGEMTKVDHASFLAEYPPASSFCFVHSTTKQLQLTDRFTHKFHIRKFPKSPLSALPTHSTRLRPSEGQTHVRTSDRVEETHPCLDAIGNSLHILSEN
jgi:WD40 repeat protein